MFEDDWMGEGLADSAADNASIRRSTLTEHRIVLLGGLIGITAAWAYFALDGLASATGLIIGAFDLAVLAGVAAAALVESRRQTVASLGASIRAIRHSHATQATCGVCARFVVDNGTATFCPSCDRIAVRAVA
jgi:Zn finger protein HypA/HybF involved in hydrogenase expression